MSDPKTAERWPGPSHQQNWFNLVKQMGEPAARAHLVAKLRAAADQIERGSYPKVFGCELREHGLPMETISVTLSHPWGG